MAEVHVWENSHRLQGFKDDLATLVPAYWSEFPNELAASSLPADYVEAERPEYIKLFKAFIESHAERFPRDEHAAGLKEELVSREEKDPAELKHAEEAVEAYSWHWTLRDILRIHYNRDCNEPVDKCI